MFCVCVSVFTESSMSQHSCRILCDVIPMGCCVVSLSLCLFFFIYPYKYLPKVRYDNENLRDKQTLRSVDKMAFLGVVAGVPIVTGSS